MCPIFEINSGTLRKSKINPVSINAGIKLTVSEICAAKN